MTNRRAYMPSWCSAIGRPASFQAVMPPSRFDDVRVAQGLQRGGGQHRPHARPAVHDHPAGRIQLRLVARARRIRGELEQPRGTWTAPSMWCSHSTGSRTSSSTALPEAHLGRRHPSETRSRSAPWPRRPSGRLSSAWLSLPSGPAASGLLAWLMLRDRAAGPAMGSGRPERDGYPSRVPSTSSPPPSGSLLQLRRAHSSLSTSSAAFSRNSGRAQVSTSKSFLM